MVDWERNKLVEILLVEDNPGDVRLILEAFKEGDGNINIHLTKDGVDAMAFLRREGEYNYVTRPDLILLDLNLPKKDGKEVLAEIKSDENLKYIPVLVLTTSKAETDIAQAYHMHANCYITKPANLDQFTKMIRHIEDFWLSTATLPPV